MEADEGMKKLKANILNGEAMGLWKVHMGLLFF
jgi:hypothetical protein